MPANPWLVDNMKASAMGIASWSARRRRSNAALDLMDLRSRTTFSMSDRVGGGSPHNAGILDLGYCKSVRIQKLPCLMGAI
jgi:hypothetical protein